MAKKPLGLVLTLGGAPPASPHVVPGLPGYYRTDVPTPVTDEVAEKAKKIDCVKVVELTPSQVDKGLEAQADAVAEGANAIRDAKRRTPAGSEPEHISDETTALKGA